MTLGRIGSTSFAKRDILKFTSHYTMSLLPIFITETVRYLERESSAGSKRLAGTPCRMESLPLGSTYLPSDRQIEALWVVMDKIPFYYEVYLQKCNLQIGCAFCIGDDNRTQMHGLGRCKKRHSFLIFIAQCPF